MNAIQWTAEQICRLGKQTRPPVTSAYRKALDVCRKLGRAITAFDVAKAHEVANATASDWLKQARETGVLVCTGRRSHGNSRQLIYDIPKRRT